MRKKSYLFWNSLPLGNTHLEFEPLSSQRMGQTSTYLVDVPPTTYLVDGLSKKIFFPFTLNGMAMATSASIISK
jgi:hypothetical protein